MRYMMMIKATKDYEAGIPPSRELMAGMEKSTEEFFMQRCGAMFDGTFPSWEGQATAVAQHQRRWGGLCIAGEDPPRLPPRPLSLRQPPLQWRGFSKEAISLADRVVCVHIDTGISEFEMEMRPLFDAADFGPAHR